MLAGGYPVGCQSNVLYRMGAILVRLEFDSADAISGKRI